MSLPGLTVVMTATWFRALPFRSPAFLTSRRARTRLGTAPVLALALVTAGCEDPFEIRWEAQTDSALIYSLARTDPNLPTAFNFYFRAPITIEAPGSTGQWDVALDTQGGGLVLLPPRALGINSRARIAPLPGIPFNDVTEAPADTAAYVSNRPVPLALGTTYVVQTSEQSGSFGQRCVFFAKMEPLVLDVVRGTLRFLYDASPVCNDTRLIPPDS
jgi:hypothetical protein